MSLLKRSDHLAAFFLRTVERREKLPVRDFVFEAHAVHVDQTKGLLLDVKSAL